MGVVMESRFVKGKKRKSQIEKNMNRKAIQTAHTTLICDMLTSFNTTL